MIDMNTPNGLLGLMAINDAFSGLSEAGGGPVAQPRAVPLMLQMAMQKQQQEQKAEQERKANEAYFSALGITPGPAQTVPTAGPGGYAGPVETKPLAAPGGFNFDDVRQSLIRAESGGDPTAVSPKGAVGLTQIMPATARDPGYGVPNIFDTARGLGVAVPDESEATLQSLLRNPQVNEAFGANYFNAMSQKYGGDPRKTLAAYNAGPGAVDQYGGVPPFEETQAYVGALAPSAPSPQPVAAPEPRFPPEILDLARAEIRANNAAGARKILNDYTIRKATQTASGPRIAPDAAGFLRYVDGPQAGQRVFPGVEKPQKPQDDPIAALNARADAAGLAPGSEERRQFMLRNGQVEPPKEYDYKGESDLRKEFIGQQTVKDFRKQATAYGRIVASAKDPSAAGDLAMIFNYMKVLDPGSVVRESEFATAERATAWLQSSEEAGITVPRPIASGIRQIATGQRLSPEQRADFVNRGRMLYEDAERQYDGLRGQYAQIAEGRFDVDKALPDYRYVPGDDSGAPVVVDGYKIRKKN